MQKTDDNGRDDRILTRREALAISAKYGATVASVGFAYMLGDGACRLPMPPPARRRRRPRPNTF